MKRSIIFAAVLTLVLAASAVPSEPVFNDPTIFGFGNNPLAAIYVGFDGDVALDGAVDYGVGTGYRRPSEGETDGAVDYGVGTGYRRPSEGETDAAVGYGAGTGPRAVYLRETDAAIGYGAGTGPRRTR